MQRPRGQCGLMCVRDSEEAKAAGAESGESEVRRNITGRGRKGRKGLTGNYGDLGEQWCEQQSGTT